MNQATPSYFVTPLLNMPAVAQLWTLWIFAIAFVGTVGLAAIVALKMRSAKPMFYVVGAVVAGVLDTFFGHLGHAVHAQVGQINAVQALGVSVPVHAILAYSAYFPPAFLYLIPRLKRRQFTSGQLWWLFLGLTIGAFLFEVPFNMLGVWRYTGPQPFQFFPTLGLQPLWWSTASAAMIICGAGILAGVDEFFDKNTVPLLIAMTPMAIFATAASVCWPTWLALNSTAPPVLQYVAACATIGMSALELWLVTKFFAEQRPRLAY